MGCGASSVPDEIIPDPEPGQKCKVLFKKQGTFAKDQEVFFDCDKSKKWLFLDKEGGLFSEPKFWLDNYVRKDGSKQGQTLCSAKLKLTQFKKYGHKVNEDSDSDISDSSNSDVEVSVKKEKFKWAQTVQVLFFNGREFDKVIAEVKVKAKGKAKRTTVTIETQVDDHDEEGNKTGEHTETTHQVDIHKKVKKVKYNITMLDGEKDKEKLPEIKLKGKPNGNAYKLEWDGPVFQAEIDSSMWGSTEIEVATDWKNPALGMLMGYIIAKEISPDDLKDNVSIF